MTLENMLSQARAWGIRVSEDQRRVLCDYAQILADYKKANVIGTRVLEEILVDHILDSLSCLMFRPLSEAESLVDVGSGGGLPGVPIKILRPETRTVLLESTGKKAGFLSHAVEELRLDGVEVLGERAEDVGVSRKYRGKFDVATVRAVSRLDVNCEYCVPFLKEGGYMISMKSSIDKAEISAGENAARLLGAEVSEIIPVPFLPELPDKERNLVVVRKHGPTPDLYPREKGTPKKKPLGVG